MRTLAPCRFSFFFFLNDAAPPEISPLPLHAPLPICEVPSRGGDGQRKDLRQGGGGGGPAAKGEGQDLRHHWSRGKHCRGLRPSDQHLERSSAHAHGKVKSDRGDRQGQDLRHRRGRPERPPRSGEHTPAIPAPTKPPLRPPAVTHKTN